VGAFAQLASAVTRLAFEEAQKGRAVPATGTRKMGNTRARRDAIQELLRSHEVSTQQELRDLLKERGFDVTQATLSRDLARLGARRASRPHGGTTYELSGHADGGSAEELLAGVREMVTAVQENGSLVVVTTHPGAAPAVALAIDLARLPDSLGTIAGDDTIFLAPRQSRQARRVARRLRSLLGKGKAQ
jgi:transcriptional regulator of arginine metabolism